jgi:serine beta-lactamase-like protein LACTB
MPMLMNCASLLIALLSLSGPVQAGNTMAPARVDPATAARQSDRLLAELVAHNGVPGMGAAVWQDGRIVWRGSAGLRDLAASTPVDGNTIFRLASVSKLITVAAAAQLADAGKLDLDAPVASQWDGVNPAWAPFTMRQLAAHTAGLPHYQALDADRGRIPHPRATDAVAIFRDRPLLSAPGHAYSYSSWGYTLISAVVEARSGQAFLDYVARHVTPGLRIGPDATHGGDPYASKAYALDGSGRTVEAPRHDYSYTWGGGGFGATASALAEFGGRMQRGQVVSARRFADMLVPARLDDGTEVRDDDYTVGFGWRTLTDLDGRLRAQHAGATLGARSSLVTWPRLPRAEQTAVALLSNMEWVSSIDQSAAMLAAPFQAVPAGLVSGSCPTAATRFGGMFRDAAATGAAHFNEEAGSCIGTLRPDGALKAYFDQFPQPDRDTLRIIGLYPGHGLARAVLVTPIGLYDLRATADGQFIARLGATSELRFTLDGTTAHTP